MSIEYAINKAKESVFIRGQKRMYAVIYDKKNRLVCEAANSYVQTHPKAFYYGKKTGNPAKCYLHCELAVLLKDKNRRGVKIVIARVDSKGVPCLAAPCPACALALKEYSNIKSIEYTI